VKDCQNAIAMSMHFAVDFVAFDAEILHTKQEDSL